MIYFLYNIEDGAPYIKEVGMWGNTMVGAIEEDLLLYIKMSDVTIIPKDIAYAWKFAGKYKGYIKIRENTNSYDQIDTSLLEVLENNKFKYTLLEKDKENSCLFHKAIMYFILNKYYNNKILISNSTNEEFRGEGWKSEAELMQDKNKIMLEIKSCQNWEETGILISNRFGIGHSPEALVKIDL